MRSLLKSHDYFWVIFILFGCYLSACDDSEEQPIAHPPPLPNLKVDQPIRGVLLGVWGASPTLTEVTAPAEETQREDRVWFVGGTRKGQLNESLTETRSLIAVYQPTFVNGTEEEKQAGEVKLHYEGERGALWWVWGSGARGEVWTAGEHGAVWRLDDTKSTGKPWIAEEVKLSDLLDDQYSEMLDKLVIWGIWGMRDSQNRLVLWAVGGSVRRGGPRGVLLKRDFDGTWHRIQHSLLPLESADDPLVGRNLYKIWGRDRQVWIVGEGGLTLTADLEEIETPRGKHLSLTRWETIKLAEERSELLFTVTGSLNSSTENTTWVVGGYEKAKAWRWSKVNSTQTPQWEALNMPTLPALNGIHVAEDLVVGVGQRSLITAWHPQIDLSHAEALSHVGVEGAEHMTLHSIYRNKHKGYWIVGGDLSTLEEGILISPDQWDQTQSKVRREPW